jgi:hypothetical protein
LLVFAAAVVGVFFLFFRVLAEDRSQRLLSLEEDVAAVKESASKRDGKK